MTKIHDVSNVSLSDREHLAKADMIHNLEGYYNSHDQSLLKKLCNFILLVHSFTHEHHHSIVHTDNFKQ